MDRRSVITVLALAACNFEIAELPPVCDPDVAVCPPGASTGVASTTGDDGWITGEVQTVTGGVDATSATAGTSTSAGEPDETTAAPAVPSVVSVTFDPDPLEFAGSIQVDVLADHAQGVRMLRPNSPPVELAKGPGGHFHGDLAQIHSGLSNGTYEVTFIPWAGEVEGEPDTRWYTVALPEAGSLFLWATMPDHGLGEVKALRVTDSGYVVAFMTVYQNGTPRCALHRRDLEGKYTEADEIRIIFADKECRAIDLEIDGDALYLLASMKGGDESWFWRVASATWGQQPTILRTGAKGEIAHALARSPSGNTAICGTAPSPNMIDDTIDGCVWPLVGPPVQLDYVAPDDPQKKDHKFDETLRDCAFVGDRLVTVGDVFGRHEEELWQPKRTRPLIVEMDGQAEPVWTVGGLGPGNTTQGSISALAIDDEGRYITGLYTCGDTCDQQGEIRIYEPGGKLWWSITLGAKILPPQDVAWSPAGYIALASAEVAGQWSSKFVVQAYIPGQYDPVWTFAKAEMPNLHLGNTLAVVPGAIIGAGFGGAGFPVLAFLRP